jgi:hypothetical protein
MLPREEKTKRNPFSRRELNQRRQISSAVTRSTYKKVHREEICHNNALLINALSKNTSPFSL